jgi:hypothetical protein
MVDWFSLDRARTRGPTMPNKSLAPLDPTDPVPHDVIAKIQQAIGSATVYAAGAVMANEQCGWIARHPDGSFHFSLKAGLVNTAPLDSPPPGAIAFFHSHPPMQNAALDDVYNATLNPASWDTNPNRPGDVQRMYSDGARQIANGVVGAYVFGPTEVHYYNFAVLTNTIADRLGKIVLSGKQVSWPHFVPPSA